VRRFYTHVFRGADWERVFEQPIGRRFRLNQGSPDPPVTTDSIPDTTRAVLATAADREILCCRLAEKRGRSQESTTPLKGREFTSMLQRTSYIILPYLTTSRPVDIRGIQFRSSLDLEGISTEDIASLKTLFSMFFLHGDLRIREMIYAILKYDSDHDSSFNDAERRLSESCFLIEYLYTYPHAGWQTFQKRVENASMYLFQERNISATYQASDQYAESISERAQEPDGATLPGFAGVLMRRNEASITVIEGSRIYPPDHSIHLSIIFRDLSQAISSISPDKTKWALTDLIADRSRLLTNAERRCLRAMRWFNDSCRSMFFEDQSILLLAIAFETLLNIDPGKKDRVTERLRLAIKAIVGGFPRIDSWVKQFYDARCRIVHEGGSPDFAYHAQPRPEPSTSNKDDSIRHGSLTEYGRTIFHLCVHTLLSGSRMAEEARLEESLVHNQERLELIRRALAQRDQSPTTRVCAAAKIALELRKTWSGWNEFVDTKKLLATLKSCIEIYSSESPGQPWALPAELESLIEAVRDERTARNDLEIYRKVLELHQALCELPWYDRGYGVKGENAASLVLAVVSYAAAVAPTEARSTRSTAPDRAETNLDSEQVNN
jgi:hypothetical protein